MTANRAAEQRYGRRGGGWLAKGHDPTKPKKAAEPERAKTKAELDEEQRRRVAREEIAAYEAANDIVPGTSSYTGKQPSGGVTWRGQARMAHARKAAGLSLGANDLKAIARFPTMPPLVDDATQHPRQQEGPRP